MDNERNTFKALKIRLNAKGVLMERDDERPSYIKFMIDGPFGKRTIFQVNVDDLFDKNGNRFLDNI
jgi:hypothetical protein